MNDTDPPPSSSDSPSGSELLIPLSAPMLGGNAEAYILDCLKSSWVSSSGHYVDRFERMLAEYVGAKCAVATSSGTAALHVALLVAGVKPGDLVLTPTLSFIAPANAVRYIGADPVFFDADPETWQVDVKLVQAFLTSDCRRAGGDTRHSATGRRIGAILPVHVLGMPVDLDPLYDLGRRNQIPVVEDAAEALGSSYKGKRIGGQGDIVCFSFNGNKVVTTGGGGAIVTPRADWAARARHLTTQAKNDPIEYEHDEIGYNYRLSNLAAALGLAQLERLEEHLEAKLRIAKTYEFALATTPGVQSQRQQPDRRSNHWLTTVLIDETKFGEGSRALLARLAKAGVESRPLWRPLHRSPAHKTSIVIGGEVADRLHSQALSLPSSVGLSMADQSRVIDLINSTGEKTRANHKRSQSREGSP